MLNFRHHHFSRAMQRSALRRFRRAQSGAAALEFAFIAPVLMLFLMGTVEFSLAQFANSLMEMATFNAARLGKTGYAASGQTRQQAILAVVQARTKGLLDPAQLTMTSVVYPNFISIGVAEPYVDANHNGSYDPGESFTDVNGNGVWDADLGTAGLGGPGDIVVYTVSYPWKFHTPLIGKFFGSSQTLTLSVRAVVKNEPFNG